jgi:hypothetical protein
MPRRHISRGDPPATGGGMAESPLCEGPRPRACATPRGWRAGPSRLKRILKWQKLTDEELTQIEAECARLLGQWRRCNCASQRLRVWVYAEADGRLRGGRSGTTCAKLEATYQRTSLLGAGARIRVERQRTTRQARRMLPAHLSGTGFPVRYYRCGFR